MNLKHQIGSAKFHDMQRYMFVRAIAPALVLLYAVAAVSITKHQGGRELYPFFNWSLFSSTGTPRGDSVLLLKSINGVPLTRPTLFYEARDTFYSARTRDSRLGKALGRMVVSIRRGDEKAELALRTVVERNFMREARLVEYDLAVITYDPIERYNTGKIQSVQIVKSYQKNDSAE